jgi:hypothetical protein
VRLTWEIIFDRNRNPPPNSEAAQRLQHTFALVLNGHFVVRILKLLALDLFFVNRGCFLHPHPYLVCEHTSSETCEKHAHYYQGYADAYPCYWGVREALCLIGQTKSDFDTWSHRWVTSRKDCIGIEQQKCFEVSLSNTIIHPGAVVIHHHDTPATHGAMMTPWRLATLTLDADSIVFLQHFGFFLLAQDFIIYFRLLSQLRWRSLRSKLIFYFDHFWLMLYLSFFIDRCLLRFDV